MVLTSFPLSAASPDLLFDAGNKAYLEGDYDEALQYWLQIEDQGYKNGELFYNIGNAYHKKGDLGKSILYWEKATEYLGGDEDLEANLEMARSKLVDKIENPVRLPVWDWFDNFRAVFGTDAIAVIAIICSFSIFLLLGLKRWAIKNPGVKNWFARFAWTLLIILVIDLMLIVFVARDDYRNRYGVVLAHETEVLSAPAEGTGRLLFTLHEGAKVQILRELENWTEIEIGKDKRGWMKNGELGVI